MSTTVVLVDDHTIFRQCMQALLDQEDDIEVVGVAENGRAAIDLVHELSPDVVVMDVTMPSMNGIDATSCIVREKPGVKVIALSMHGHHRFVQDMLTAGASGYLLKECAFEELVQAVRLAVERDQIYLSPDVSRMVVEGYIRNVRGQSSSDDRGLTVREHEVLQLIAEGSTSRQIAEILGVSVRTVENHRANIMKKLDEHSLAGLIRYAVREGLTPL